MLILYVFVFECVREYIENEHYTKRLLFFYMEPTFIIYVI